MPSRDFEKLINQGFAYTEDAQRAAEAEIAILYRDAYDQALKELAALYAKLGDEINLPEARKYRRLEALLKSIEAEYKSITGQSIAITGKNSFSNYQDAFYRYTWSMEQAVVDGQQLDVAKVMKGNFELTWGVVPTDAIVASVMSESSGLTYIKTFSKNMDGELWRIQSAITRGIANGHSYAKTARSLKDLFDGGYSSAQRVLRTEAGRNYTEGNLAAHDRAAEVGIKVRKRWVSTLDGRTRHTHAVADGQIADKDGNFHVGGAKGPGPGLIDSLAEDINCFTGAMIPVADKPIVMYRRWYSGQIVRIKTALGSYLEVTPNHPILTSVGWVRAGLLDKGYNILSVDGREFADVISSDIENRPTSFGEMFDLSPIMVDVYRVPGEDAQFHGDGSNGEVEIKTINWGLSVKDKPSFFTFLEEEVFSLSNILHRLLSRYGILTKMFGSSHHSPNRIMRRFGEALSFFGRCLGHPEKHGFASSPLDDSIPIQNSNDDMTCNSKRFSETLNRKPGFILLDEIESVDFVAFEGHVYNLHTVSGMYGVYNGNGIVSMSHNCRCRFIDELEGFPPNYRRAGEDILPYVPFSEWAAPLGWTEAKGWPRVQ
jgi:hypothetical protein